jgi:hypothetical protein
VVDFAGGNKTAAIWLTGPASTDADNKDSRSADAEGFGVLA